MSIVHMSECICRACILLCHSHSMMLNEIAEDQSGKTPLHYMTVSTKLSAIKRFNSVEKGSDSAIDGEGVSVLTH